MLDTFKHQGLRRKLVETLREKGIPDEEVLAAVGKVPRHGFVESAFADSAYEDRPMPIGDDQTISQPFTVAAQSTFLKIKPGHKVLEIGTGSGYQAAVLCEMGAQVFSIERIRAHHNRAKKILDELGYVTRLKCGDGSEGWRTFAPFDRIIVTAASPNIPVPLKEQLAIGGRLVIPFGDKEKQVMGIVVRKSRNDYTIEKRGNFAFVPMIGKYGWNK